jgi:hypothetical protein
MTYITDGEEYTYRSLPEGVQGVAVGWLDDSHGFSTGQPDTGFVEALADACRAQLRAITRGWMVGTICWSAGHSAYPTTALIGGEERALGSAEIWVVREDGVWLCAPNMILHYVTAHSYLPPADFVSALKAGRFAPPVSQSPRRSAETWFQSTNRDGLSWTIPPPRIPTVTGPAPAVWLRGNDHVKWLRRDHALIRVALTRRPTLPAPPDPPYRLGHRSSRLILRPPTAGYLRKPRLRRGEFRQSHGSSLREVVAVGLADRFE